MGDAYGHPPYYAQGCGVLPDAMMSAASACENATKLVDRRVPLDGVPGILADLDVEIVPFGESDALLAAGLSAITRPAGLSFGDRACLALAQSRGLPVYTADRLWASLNLPVDIRLVR